MLKEYLSWGLKGSFSFKKGDLTLSIVNNLFKKRGAKAHLKGFFDVHAP